MSESLLEGINGVDDVKKLSLTQLKALCLELREYILSVVSQNGGHLASNLGVIELSVALEYIFDTRADRLVWDVGHQSYTHKILTGRRSSFPSLRQADGLSGFPKRAESICDPYDTGHSSTSISAALGFAKARDLRGEDHKVIALIGDGSMTGGQAFEALNLAGDLKTDILVILNDNHMSIARNIGGISHYLNRLRSSSAYTGSKQAVRKFLSKIPFIGNVAIHIIEKLKDSLRYILVNGIVFSELGFQYYGPVNGHDLDDLIGMLEQVKEIKGPVLLHVVTQKGRGYQPAAENATVYHGIAPFDLETGKTSHEAEKSTQTYTEAFSKALVALAESDPRITAVTAAMADGTGLESFHQLYPDRFFDVGIAEQTAVSFGTALALSGFRPVVAVYSSFLQRAYDQLIQDAALQKAPVVFALDRSGLVGEDGPTHHGVFDLSYLSQIPNMAVLLPRDEFMLSYMLKLACAYDDGPAAIRYPRGKGVGAAAIENTNPLLSGAPQWGKGQMLRLGKWQTTHLSMEQELYHDKGQAPHLGTEQALRHDNEQAPHFGTEQVLHHDKWQTPRLGTEQALPHDNEQTPHHSKQVLIIAAGDLLYEALSAAGSLEEEGYDVAVFDPCFLKPLDASGIWDAARDCDLIVTAEENVAPGGLGWAVTQLLSQYGYQGRIRCLCVPDEFVPQGSQKALKRRLGFDAESFAAMIREEL